MKIFALFLPLFFLIPSLHGQSKESGRKTLTFCDKKLGQSLSYSPVPVQAPDLKKLPFSCEGKIKTFELTAMEVKTSFHKGFSPGPLYTWGYNGSMPGPVIEAIEGERIRVKFKNNLPEATTVHWHGLELPIDMDGASGFSHPPIPPGGTYIYEFDLKQSGTYMYHSGHGIAKQLAMGLSGFFIIHPKKAPVIKVDKDFLLFLQMWTVPPHSTIPDTMDMMFNYFTVNGKTAPSTSPLNVKKGEKVRIRFANISMMQHPFHLHGHTWKLVATGAGDNSPTAFTKGNTVLVPVGKTLDVIVENIEEPGDWLLHCHLPHHVTNNMEIDPVPGEPMHHGEAGMFTLFKVQKKDEKPPMDGHSKDPSSKMGEHGHHGGPQIGIYKGHITFNNKKNFKVTFDLHKVQEEGEWRKLRAFLKIDFPGQNIGKENEYLIYQYDHIKYNFKKKLLYLEEEKNYGLFLRDLTFKKKGHKVSLVGKVYSPFSGLEGTIEAVLGQGGHHHEALKSMSMPTMKNFVPTLGGEYRGKCEKKECIVQIEVARGLHSDLSEQMNPYSSLIIKGRIGGMKYGSHRVDATLLGGIYDPFKGTLDIKVKRAGKEEPLGCSVYQKHKKQYIECDGILVYKEGGKKDEKKTVPLMPFHLKLPSSAKVNQLGSLSSLQGIFTGYLKIPQGNKTLPLELKIVSKKYAEKPMRIPTPQISGSIKIFMGGDKKAPYLGLKFKERPWLDSSSSFSKGKSFLTLWADDKIYLVVSIWKEQSLEGILYHKDFGRIGPFQVIRGQDLIPLPHHFSTLSLVTGNWISDDYQLNLSISSGTTDEDKEGNPFFPLTLSGSLKNKITNQTLSINHGSFNPFNGSFSFMTQDSRIAIGKKEGNVLQFFLPSVDKRRARLVPQSKVLKFNLKR